MAYRAFTKWLNQSCTLLTYTTARNSIGELGKTAGTVATAVRCRLMRNAISQPNPNRTEQVNKLDAVYFDGTVSLATFQRISNIVDKNGTVIEAGPLDVIEPIARRDIRRARLLAVTVEKVGHSNRT